MGPFLTALTEALNDIVDGFTLSYLDGVTKPDPAIYAKTCERLGLTATEVLMVGDHPNNDVAGAIAYGMGAALVPAEGMTVEWVKGLLLC